MTDEPFLSATRTAYNTVAVSYAELVPAVEEDHPVNRAVLCAFADLVRAAGGGPVADIGRLAGPEASHVLNFREGPVQAKG